MISGRIGEAIGPGTVLAWCIDDDGDGDDDDGGE
jgi:hypothetical protein